MSSAGPQKITISGRTEIGKLTRDRYEALPEGYGLGHNMLAGAFAGIAVSSIFEDLMLSASQTLD